MKKNVLNKINWLDYDDTPLQYLMVPAGGDRITTNIWPENSFSQYLDRFTFCLFYIVFMSIYL